jgi:hypothetical protein
MSSTQLARQVTFLAKMDGELRTASHGGHEHLIVPTIAIMEGVVWPFASEVRELVLASELEAMDVRSWNGRPVTMDHPTWDGRLVPANDPKVLDRYCFGRVFEAEMRGKKLHMESWLDLNRADSMGSETQSVVRRARNHEEIEVSVGVFITAEEKTGVYNGVRYDHVWRNIVADHLAMLPEDAIGACSVDMGCGAPRAARAARAARHVHYFDINSENIRIEERSMPDPVGEKRSLRERLIETFGFKTAKQEGDLSQSDLWRNLESLLYSNEPAFLGVVDVFPADEMVVYAVAPDNTLQTFRRKYSVDGENKVSLGGTRKEVEPVTRYETLTDGEQVEEPVVTSAADCGCGGKKMAVAKERITALINSKKNGFAVAHQNVLESMTEEQIKALEDADALQPDVQASTPQPPTPTTPGQPAPSPAPAPSTPPPTSPTPPKTLSAAEQEVEWRRTAPPTVLAMIDEKIAQDAAEKTSLITGLAGKQKVYSDSELTAMDLTGLRKLSALVGVESKPVLDFSARGLRSATDDNVVPPARSLKDALGEKKTAAR